MTVDSSEGEESGFEKQFCVLKLITGPIFYFLKIFFDFFFFNMRICFFTLLTSTRDKMYALLAQYSA